MPGELTQYGLAIDTTSSSLGLAIDNLAGEHRSQTWNLGRELATKMHDLLFEFIQPQTWQDLAFIAVAKGPGSFTGTRLGVVTARTLAQQLNIPLFAISTLAAAVWERTSHLLSIDKQQIINQQEQIAIQMPAQRGELFVAIYEVTENIEPLLPDSVMTQGAWERELSNSPNPHRLISMPPNSGVSPSSLLEIAHGDWQRGKRPHWSDALPFYGQHPV